MYLTALEIQGFKSFPDRTKIKIEKGITAVVGPNGSGKSNISDAIRWVLGETSAKQLRGGGKMENVIFGGTQTRGAMGFAHVSLYVDNTDRRIDVNADEVVIGRKYYRSGESEYAVNGQNVRLKDIYELFLDTGLGRDGYSVIGQGRIAEIVGAKSNERREIFEEASGIARYRYRKNEAERRLASAEENLVRLRDILGELEERVGPLEKDSKKAQQFLTLSETRKELEVTLWVDTVHKAKDTLREQQRKIEIAGADYNRMTAEMDEIDAQTAETRREIETLILDSDRCNSEIRAISAEIAGSDAHVAVLRNNIEHNEAGIASLRGELAQGSAGRAHISEEEERHEEAIQACRVAIAANTERVSELGGLLENLQTQSAASGERRGVITAKLNEMATRITDWKVQSASAAGAAEAAGARLVTARGEGETARQHAAELRTEQTETYAFLQETMDTLTKLENIKGGLALKLASRRSLLQEAEAAEQALLRTFESTTQRIAMLKDLERNMDGFGGSVKTVMKASENRRLRGIIGPVATVLSVKPGYEVAIETALGFALQNIVVENESAAKAAMVLLRDEKAGRATFLPLDTMKPGYFDGKLTGSAVRASALVTYDARYEKVVSNLLGRIIVVDDINEASGVARSLDYRNRIVTVDGQIINAGGSFTGGSVSRSAGLFSRKQEIESLKQKRDALQQERAAAAEAAQAAKAAVDALAAELTATESEAVTAGGDKIRCEVERARIATALSQAEALCTQLQAECVQLEQIIAAGAAQADTAAAQTEQLTRDSKTLEQELLGISGTDDSFLSTRARLADELAALRMEMLAGEKDIEQHKAAIVNLRQRTGDADERARTMEASIAALTEQNEQFAQDVEAVHAGLQDSRAAIAAREAQIAAAAAQRIEKEGGIAQQNQRVKQRTAEREALSREIARLTEQKENKDAEYEQTLAKLWEEYELTLSEAELFCVVFESSAELRRQVAELRAKIKGLGNVNVGAIEEYAEVSQRYEFMRAQVGDVEQSKAELTKLIAGLSDEMRTIFTESFAQINHNFKRIFAELFGGGTAALTLADTADVLESGIEIEVAPPGKIIKNLSSLSGGEQALVAISIYFAILAVNPAPFCVLDEIEAALDDVNVTRFAQYLRRITTQTQFVVITHRRGTMEEADVLYGVTMQEDGISKLLRLDVNSVDASLVI